MARASDLRSCQLMWTARCQFFRRKFRYGIIHRLTGLWLTSARGRKGFPLFALQIVANGSQPPRRVREGVTASGIKLPRLTHTIGRHCRLAVRCARKSPHAAQTNPLATSGWPAKVACSGLVDGLCLTAKSTALQIPDKLDLSATSGAILTSHWSRLLIPTRAMANS